MTSLRSVLAFNMKLQRQVLGVSQKRLAARVGTSTHYIGMIESEKKFPTPEMLERIAAALDIDAPALFSTKAYPAPGDGTLEAFRRDLASDIEQAILYRIGKLDSGLIKGS